MGSVSRPAIRSVRTSSWARRTVAASVLATGAGAQTVWSGPYRSLEARVAATGIGLVTPTRVSGSAWHMDRGHAGLWFVVTALCTSGLLIVPVALVGATLTLTPIITLRRAIGGLVAGMSVVVALSLGRLIMIGLAWRAWGDPSLWVTHQLIGTLVSLIAMVLGVATQLAVTGRGSGP